MTRSLRFTGSFATTSDRDVFKSWFQSQYGADYQGATALFFSYQISGIFLSVDVDFISPDTYTEAGMTTTFPVLADIEGRAELLNPKFIVTEIG